VWTYTPALRVPPSKHQPYTQCSHENVTEPYLISDKSYLLVCYHKYNFLCCWLDMKAWMYPIPEQFITVLGLTADMQYVRLDMHPAHASSGFGLFSLH